MPAQSKGKDERRRATLAAVAPGTQLRDGLERILRGHTGGLIVLGYDRTVAGLCTGGVPPHAGVSSTRPRGLAQKDGARLGDRTRPPLVPGGGPPPPGPAEPPEE